MLLLARLKHLLFIALVVVTYSTSQEVGGDEDEYYEDGYEYYEDGYEDEAVELNVDGTSTIKANKPFHGYHKNTGGGVVKVKQKLMTEAYLDDTARIYDCLKEADSAILQQDAQGPVEEFDDEEEEDDAEPKHGMDEMNSMLANGTDMSELDTKNDAGKIVDISRACKPF